jgi:hypothetical protein
LLLLFVSYYSSITLFYHSHFVDGRQITHSHPYIPASDNGSPSHQHTDNEFLLIQMLTHFSSVAAVIFFFSMLRHFLYSRFISRIRIVFFKEPCALLFLNKAPPAKLQIPFFSIG